MTYKDYDLMFEELRPFLVKGKRLAITEWKWMEKKGAVRIEPVKYVRNGVTTESFEKSIVDVAQYKKCEAILDDFNRCEYGKQKRLEELQP